jgi:hypothetical protein
MPYLGRFRLLEPSVECSGYAVMDQRKEGLPQFPGAADSVAHWDQLCVQAQRPVVQVIIWVNQQPSRLRCRKARNGNWLQSRRLPRSTFRPEYLCQHRKPPDWLFPMLIYHPLHIEAFTQSAGEPLKNDQMHSTQPGKKARIKG